MGGELDDLRLRFEARGATGVVNVRVRTNTDPAAIGTGPHADGFPVCEATVSIDLQGYAALFGWVQLVGTESAAVPVRRFETDPLEVFGDLDLPFGFYGMRPTLFDAPSRRDRHQTLHWLAHSFLCVSPTRPMDRTVVPVAAFQWGFWMYDGRIEIVPPGRLGLPRWNGHLDVLRARHPAWSFDPVAGPDRGSTHGA